MVISTIRVLQGIEATRQLEAEGIQTHISLVYRYISLLNFHVAMIHVWYTGLMWSLFLIGFLYVSGVWQVLLLRMDTKKTSFVMLDWQIIDTILGSKPNTNRSAYVTTQRDSESSL